MKNMKQHENDSSRSLLSAVARRARRGAQRYAQPMLSGILALSMVLGSVPAPAYAEMLEEAAGALAPLAYSADESAISDAAEEQGGSTTGETSSDQPAPAVDTAAGVTAEPKDDDDALDDAQTQPDVDDPVENDSLHVEPGAPTEAKPADKPKPSGETTAQASGNESKGSAQEGPVKEAPVTLFYSNKNLKAATVGGDALASRAAMEESLQEAGASARDAKAASVALAEGVQDQLALVAGAQDEARGIAAAWLTEGDEPSGDPDQLLFRPKNNHYKTMRFRLTYAVSGEHEHHPGDVTIAVPTHMFFDRTGKPADDIRLAVPAEPATGAGWNYRVVEHNGVEEFHIVNTRSLNAATQGFIDIEVNRVEPVTQIDMKPSRPFSARLEVVENDGTDSQYESNALTAVFDTFATLNYARKGTSGEPRIVPSQDPSVAIAHKAFPDAKKFLVVDWYMHGSYDQTQLFNLKFTDEMQGSYQGVILHKDAAQDGRSVEIDAGTGLLQAHAPSVNLSTAYPIEQFEKGKSYTLENKVSMTLQEFDPQEDGSPKPEQRKEGLGSFTWDYREYEFVEPETLFKLAYFGNDNKVLSGSSYATHVKGSGVAVGDLSASNSGNYGVYGAGLNDLRAGKDVELSYTFNVDARTFPLTYQAPEGDVAGNPRGSLDNYGKKPVTITASAAALNLGKTKLEAGKDFEYANVMLPMVPTMYAAVPKNLNPDGSLVEGAREDGHFEYEKDGNLASRPTFTVEVQTADQPAWHAHATANWANNGLSVTLADGSSQTDVLVALPAGTVGVRVVTATKAAGISYYGRVGVRLKATPAAQQMAEDAFQRGTMLPAQSTMQLTAYNDAGEQLDATEQRALDHLKGFTNEMRASLKASVDEYSSNDVDKEHNRVKVTLKAELHKRSAIEERATYEQAVENDELLVDRAGVWYDLLPSGMTPILESVRLRKRDSIRSVRAVENFRGTGRTLLIVEASLTPQAHEYKKGKTAYYEDVPKIAFDAWYGAEDIADYGRKFHHVAMFRSAHDELGNVDGYRGEADDPRGTNNNGTAAAFKGEGEKILDALTDLDGVQPEHENMVYAGATGSVDPLEYGTVGLTKEVAVNGEDTWGTGNSGDEPRRVYGGATYAYRLSVTSAKTMAMKDIVLYDSLENYVLGEDCDPADKDAPRWKGVFNSIDVSQLAARGIDPVVYCSTKDDIQLSTGGTDAVAEVKKHTDLSDTSIWTRTTADELNALPADARAQITAVAIDASRATNGSDFVLRDNLTLSALIRMDGPDVDEATALVESGARAFNCVHMSNKEKPASATEWGPRTFIREGYTSVGVAPYELSVSKSWNDDKNRDGIRPAEVQVQLMANGADVPDARVTLSEANSWQASFGTQPYIDKNGATILYSVREEPAVDGYRANIAFDGKTFAIENTHDIARTSVSGRKVWVGDTAAVRPNSIKVNLLADGVSAGTQSVSGDDWTFTFDHLPVYNNGKPIEYTVQEDMGENDDYVSRVDGMTITNTYRPYGDLVITKKLHGAEALAATQEFQFKVSLARGDKPVFDKLSYVVTGAGIDPETPIEGTLVTGDIITLKAGQTARIKNAPSGATFTVQEIDIPAGYTVLGSQTVEGVVLSNQDNAAAFVNEYKANMNVHLGATKRLTGKSLKGHEFAFELRDADGALVRSATSGKPGKPVTNEQGDVVTDAAVRFGALEFTDKDSGKEFVYTLRESAGDMAGMQYSDAVYTVRVTPHDQGDGTMTADVVYEGADGVALPAGQKPLFENVYTATGEANIRVKKKLAGGELAEGQFTFDLDEVVTDEAGATSLVPVQHGVANEASGAVVFNPITFNQSHIDTSHLYAIHEVDAGDASMAYDAHYALVRVDVSDHGNGTLGIDMAFNDLTTPCFVCAGDGKMADSSVCKACEAGVITSGPQDFTFVNSWAPSGLDIEKTWADGSGAIDPKHKFEFELELTNERGQPVDNLNFDGAVIEPVSGAASAQDVSVALAAPATEESPAHADDGNDNPIAAFGALALDALGGLFAPEEAHAAEPRQILQGTSDDGNWHWSIDTATGLMTIGGTKISGTTWYGEEIAAVKSVVFEPGSVAGPSLGGRWSSLFGGLENLKSVDFTNLDTSQVTSLQLLFEDCYALETINWGSFDTSNVTSMQEMFRNCSAITSLDLSGFNTSKVTAMYRMFLNCEGLTEVNISSFDMSHTTNVGNMFQNCRSLASIDLDPLRTLGATSISGLLYGCSSLQSVDLQPLAGLALTNISSLFAGCSSLQSIDLAPMSGMALTNINALFSGCSNLKTIDLSQLNTSNVTRMNSLFAGCSSLESLDLSPLDTSNVTSTSHMFAGCASASPVDLSVLDTSKVTDMSTMFRGTKLDNFNVSALDFSSVTNVSRMFEEATSSAPFVLEMNAPQLVDAREMFRQTNLVSVDLTLNAPLVEELWMSFQGSPNLEYAKLSGDVPKLNTVNQLFRDCPKLATIDMSQLHAPVLDDMENMARNCKSLTQVDLSGITSDRLEHLDMVFQGCTSLASIDLSHLNTTSALTMDRMFQDCASLTAVDFSHSSMPKISSFDYTFSGCTALTSVVFPEKMDGGGRKISGFIETFKNCTSLKEIDLSFLGHVVPEYFDDPIEGCTSLQKIDVSSIDTSDVYIGNFGYIQNSQLYSITLPEYFNFRTPEWINIPDDPYNRGTMWVRVDESGNPVGRSYSTDELEEKYPTCGVGTYQWDTFLTLKFDLNGGNGSASDRKVNISGDIEFTVPEAVYPDHRLVGWTYNNTTIPVGQDGVARISKEDAQKLFGKKKTVTLVAQWQEVFEIAEVSKGVYRFKVPAGHVLRLPDVIPSGTSYTVRELDEAGYKLVASSGTAGVVSAGAAETPRAAFVNAELAPDEEQSARAEVRATKMLDGSAASAADGFTFKMSGYDPATGADGSWTTLVADGGAVSFPALSFDEGDLGGAETHAFNYQIREVAGGDDAIEYDRSTITATVTLARGADGSLSTKVTYTKGDRPVDRPMFENATKAAGLSISKVVEGAAAPATPFTFRMTLDGLPYEGAYSVDGKQAQAKDGVIQIAGGKTAFVDGLPAGSFYTLDEVDLPAGWTLGSTSGDTEGTLTAGARSAATFTNRYAVSAPATAQLMAWKSFPNGGLADGMFTFDLYKGTAVDPAKLVDTALNGRVDVADKVMGPNGLEIVNPHKGMAPVYFGDQSFDAPGVYEFTMAERASGDSQGVVFDKSVFHAKVSVTDNGNGTLSSSIAYTDADGASIDEVPEFVNTPKRVALELIKRVETVLPEASPARNAVFTFDIDLKDAAGDPLLNQEYRIISADGTAGEPIRISSGGTIKLRDDEHALFSDLPYGATYAISERPMSGWIIDVAASEGKLVGELTTVEKMASITVASIYRSEGSLPVTATKKFDGTLVDDQFTFDVIELKDDGTRELVATATNKADGSIDFGDLMFVLEDVGHRFTYEVVERDLGEAGIEYDPTVYTIEVTPQDNGDGTLTCKGEITRDGLPVDQIVFTNSSALDLPFTGGNGVPLMGAAVIALGCVMYLADRRRKNDRRS